MPKKGIGDPFVLPTNFVSPGSRKARIAYSLAPADRKSGAFKLRHDRLGPAGVGASAKQLRSVWAVLSNKDSAFT
jgi:hypothetical protein